MLSIGVRTARTIMDDLTLVGVSVELVNEVISFWQENEGCWGIGALVERLKLLRPGQQVSALWPTPVKGSATAQERLQASAKEAKALADAKIESARQKAAQERTAGLEKRFGALVDSFDADMQRRLLAEHRADAGVQVLLRLVRNVGKPGGLVREALLDICSELQAMAE